MDHEEIFQSVYETILSRDTRHDGVYYVGIVTTGIYCRPSCRSRTPKPENVRVYSSIQEASGAGFRPCKRCRPDDPGQHGPDAEVAHRLSELIQDRYPDNLTLGEMAGALNMSPYHMQRVFKRMTGTSPAKKLFETRMEAAKSLLLTQKLAIGDIAEAVGFRSAPHFTVAFQKAVGCSPNEYRGMNR